MTIKRFLQGAAATASLWCGMRVAGEVRAILVTKGRAPIIYRNMILTPHEADAVDTPTDLYLLMGQSNMAGRGITNAANRISSERVLKFTRDRRWAEGVEPIHYDRPFVGAGPGLAFARSMADADGHVVIGLIPCADGGTPLSRWEPGRDLYTNAIARTKAALATGGKLRGMLWHQGESDSKAKETAETYAVRLTNMVTQLRRVPRELCGRKPCRQGRGTFRLSVRRG